MIYQLPMFSADYKSKISNNKEKFGSIFYVVEE